jgi:hypothetical protein
MSRIPKACFQITILGDEDYRLLTSMKDGATWFGVFASILIAGRERLQQNKATRLEGTDALVFDNGTDHVLSLANVSRKGLDRCLAAMRAVAKETGGEPWLYLDETSHLVIRSFFKYNTPENRGGAREGAGRPRKETKPEAIGIQIDSQNNQFDTAKESKRRASLSPSDSNSNSNPPDPPAGGGVGGVDPVPGEGGKAARAQRTPGRPVPLTPSERRAASAPPAAGPPPEPKTPRQENDGQSCVVLAMEELGDSAANAVGKNLDRIRDETDGYWDAFAAAIRYTRWYLGQPGHKPIGNLIAWLVSKAQRYAFDGIPVEMDGTAVPRKEPAPPPGGYFPGAAAYIEQTMRRTNGRAE